jgi:hypothetical protein
MNKIPRRAIIYAKDIENITGRKRRTAFAMLQKIKTFYNKTSKDLITISEFCAFMGMEKEVVYEYLVD